MYKAIKQIGDYDIGDKVPDEKAELWLKMYSEPHVELVDGKSNNKIEEKVSVQTTKNDEEELEEEEVPNSDNAMLDDYLARNKAVVKKNINSDNLSKDQLEGLLKLEKDNKNRSSIIKVIEEKMKE